MTKKQAKAKKYFPISAFIQANINKVNPMDRELIFGHLVNVIKGIGETEKDMAQANCSLQIAAPTKENGDLANPKVLACIFLQMALPTKENSKLPLNTVRVSKNLQMAICIEGAT